MTHEQRTQALQEIDGLLDALTKQPDYYESLANALTREINNGWDEQTKEALRRVSERLQETGTVDQAMADAIRRELEAILGKAMQKKVSNQIGMMQRIAYKAPFIEFNINIDFDKTDQRAIEWLHRDAMYWIGDHYGSQLSQTLGKEIDTILQLRMGFEDAGKYLQERMGEQFERSRAYWNGLSNHIVTRSREFGAVSSYQKAGVKKLKVVAVVDARTTKICRHMNGRIIDVKRAVELRDNLINAKEPEDVKQIAPWLTAAQADLLTNVPDKRIPHGLALPPYHFNCRTRTVIAENDDKRKVS